MEINEPQKMIYDEQCRKNYMETLMNSYMMYEKTRQEIIIQYFTCLEEDGIHKKTKNDILKSVEMLTNEEIDVMSKYIENGGNIEDFKKFKFEKIKE